jgi:DNA-binding MarR family transcriptional regulator/GNAT superfamily N-acetyltransferase
MDRVSPLDVKAVRAFNRFYTQRIGILKRYLDTDFTLTEVRVMYELAHSPAITASDLVRELALDAGYVSRILRRFEAQGWLARTPASHDGRQSMLQLTEAGYATFAPLQQKSRAEAAQLLADVPGTARSQLITALATVHKLLDPANAERKIVLRDPAPGDLGWVVQAHGALYASEFGYTSEFEALVAEIAAQYLRKFDPEWEKGWIAEVDGERVGSVFVVRKSATVAKLRLLLLLPQARGLGLGARLTDECIAFARAKGYRKMVLWTQSHLAAARAIYKSRGFQCVAEEDNHAFGHDLTSETWELKL